jgi:hypothetical protein
VLGGARPWQIRTPDRSGAALIHEA